jgi:hypothetical protein
VVGRLDQLRPALLGVGEGAALMAEQLGLDQPWRGRGGYRGNAPVGGSGRDDSDDGAGLEPSLPPQRRPEPSHETPALPVSPSARCSTSAASRASRASAGCSWHAFTGGLWHFWASGVRQLLRPRGGIAPRLSVRLTDRLASPQGSK